MITTVYTNVMFTYNSKLIEINFALGIVLQLAPLLASYKPDDSVMYQILSSLQKSVQAQSPVGVDFFGVNSTASP